MKFPERISKIMPKVFQDLGLHERMKNWHIIENWAAIVGKRIAQHARPTSVDAENLFVEVDNPVWQGQLFILKEKIIKRIKDFDAHIKDIKFSIMKSPINKKENE